GEGLHYEQKVQMGILQSDLPKIPACFQGPSVADPRRVLSGLRLPSKICHSPAQWSPAPEAQARAKEPKGHLWHTVDRRPLPDLGGRWLSLVGAAESPAPSVDALGQKAIFSDGLHSTAAPRNQPGYHRPATGRQEANATQESLRPDQAWNPAQAPHPSEDRLL